ncbi:Arm DNA-binding domain-containing protein, partial [Vogesella fluminis]
MQIKAWIKAKQHFEGQGDGDGLWLRYRENDKVPVWRFRYKFAGKSRVMQIGSYAHSITHKSAGIASRGRRQQFS